MSDLPFRDFGQTQPPVVRIRQCPGSSGLTTDHMWQWGQAEQAAMLEPCHERTIYVATRLVIKR